MQGLLWVRHPMRQCRSYLLKSILQLDAVTWQASNADDFVFCGFLFCLFVKPLPLHMFCFISIQRYRVFRSRHTYTKTDAFRIFKRQGRSTVWVRGIQRIQVRETNGRAREGRRESESVYSVRDTRSQGARLQNHHPLRSPAKIHCHGASGH